MSVEKIIGDWKKGVFKPLYWFEGEEDYFIDKAIAFAETSILKETEASFNLTIFYGKDAGWADVVNTCRRYPMFAERQVVILKEAQQMRDIEKLEPYVENPLESTILIVAYKDKKLDARKKFTKLVKETGTLVTTRKLYERELPDWTQNMIKSKGLNISAKALLLIVDHIGNDLTRIENEIDKLVLNLGERKSITEADIEEYIGVSKDFNVFELQSALAAKDLSKSIRIIHYFEANPKAGPVQVILPSLYNFFSKLFMVLGAGTQDEKTVAAMIGINPYFMKEYMQASKLYSYPQVEKALLLLHDFNLKSVGVGSTGTSDGSLMKELVVKILA